MNYQEPDTFGKRLKQVIHGASIRGFSRKCGVSETALRAYIAGNRDPSRRALIAMARAASVSVGWLVAGDGVMRPEDHNPENSETLERQHLQAEQRLVQQEEFKKGWQLMLDLLKDDPEYNPDGVWSALLIELLAIHGLQESGCQRIQDTLKKLKKRYEDKQRNS